MTDSYEIEDVDTLGDTYTIHIDPNEIIPRTDLPILGELPELFIKDFTHHDFYKLNEARATEDASAIARLANTYIERMWFTAMNEHMTAEIIAIAARRFGPATQPIQIVLDRQYRQVDPEYIMRAWTAAQAKEDQQAA